VFPVRYELKSIAGQATDDMAHAHGMLDTKTMNTQSEYVIYRVAQKMYTLFTHQYVWNKFK